MLWWLKDTNNNQLDCNQAVADSLGLDSIAAIRGPTERFYPHDAENYFSDDLEVIHTKKPKVSIVEPVRHSGRRVLVHTRKIPLFDKRGAVVGISVFAEELDHPADPSESLRTRFLLAAVNPISAGLAESFQFRLIRLTVRSVRIADGRVVAVLTFAHPQRPISVEAGQRLINYLSPGQPPRMSHFYQDNNLSFIIDPPDDWRWAAEALRSADRHDSPHS